MKDYLGDLEDDDLIMFVVEHLKDHKPPQKLLEGLESVSTKRWHLLTDTCLRDDIGLILLTVVPFRS